RTMKVKVGIDREADVARVNAVRERVGPHVRVGIDANGAWHTDDALDAIPRFYDDGVYFVEQPVSPADLAGMAEVRRAVRIPVVADESVFSPADAAALIRANAADAISVYVGKAGGIAAARSIASLAAAAGLSCTVGSNLEMGVGSAAMIHLAMATSGI